MRYIDKIIIHHTASKWGNAVNIDEWHRQEPHAFDMIGYHYVLLNGYTDNSTDYDPIADGLIETGRPVAIAGAHCQGHNNNSIGVALVGLSGQFTDSQYRMLTNLLKDLTGRYKDAKIVFHSDLDKKKPECPGIDPVVLLENMIDG